MLTHRPLRFALASLICLPAIAAQDKETSHTRMISIAHQANAARAAGNVALANALDAEYAAMSQRMGGDDPANMSTGPQVGGGSWNAFSSPCSGTTSTTNFVGATGPIPDVATVTFTNAVAGVGTNLWDVDVNVAISHTFNADLDITLTSPAGTVVVISTDNGGGNDDVYNGTKFDDASNDSVTDHIYTNLVAAPLLGSEGRLEAFRGEDPNGTWTLSITDDLGADVGTLNSFSLDITTVSAPQSTTNTTFSKSPNVAIPDVATVTDTQVVSGVGANLAALDVFLKIQHTFNADLDITLKSPAGVIVVISTDNGGGNDNVFDGTTFDGDSTDTVTDHVYTNLVVATPLSPEGSFGAFYGADPNGTWEISVTDDLGADVGTLFQWDLVLSTCGAAPTTYCTAKATSNGCVPSIGSTGTPSATAGSGFSVNATQMINNKSCLLFYGSNGQAAIPFQGGTLCVASPIRRTVGTNTGGNPPPNDCSGAPSFDMNLFAVGGAGGSPAAFLTVPGTVVNCQWWGRDPGFIAPNNTQLSNGLQYTVGP
jgi:subtilisin-like proprotein convertase family protein